VWMKAGSTYGKKLLDISPSSNFPQNSENLVNFNSQNRSSLKNAFLRNHDMWNLQWRPNCKMSNTTLKCIN
jgi:hypothetical protein